MLDSSPELPKILILGHCVANLCDRWAKPLQARGVSCEVVKPSEELDESVLSFYDGLLLPGGNSNIHPIHAGRTEEAHLPGEYDIRRDLAAITLARKAFDQDMPTLGICRGMQEIVVAHGGRLTKLEGNLHASNYRFIGDLVQMDTPVHKITYHEGGRLFRLFYGIFDHEGSIDVNSIHYEGVTCANWECEDAQALREKFMIEATAPDSVVEAISATQKTFYIGVQPHFELDGKMHRILFDEFAKHIKDFHARRNLLMQQEIVPEQTN